MPPDDPRQGTGSCVGHGAAAAAFIACNAAVSLGIAGAITLPFVPSPDDLYRLVRCVERLQRGIPLEDTGANVADVAPALTRFGLRPMGSGPPDGRNTDVRADTVNREPMLADLARDAETTMVSVDAHPISCDPVEAITALSHGAPVLLGVPGGSKAFQEYAGGVLDVDSSAPIVDHCVLVYSWDLSTDTGRILNSWGLLWGEKGTARISGDFLRRNCADAYSLAVKRVQ
jgi:hypothetical protein